MNTPPPTSPLRLRILVVDDEATVRDAYRAILEPPAATRNAALDDLRSKLFAGKTQATAPERPERFSFDVSYAGDATRAVEQVRDALAVGEPFAVVFLDMRMPPGPDGAWAAEQIRRLDPFAEIVVCTAFSDVDPADISARVPPEERLLYLQKPFHTHEIRQLAVSLGCKWISGQRVHRLAYFDSLTGLPNRESFRNELAASIAHARRHRRTMALLCLDLDNFKRINDTLGHAVGDELLRKISDLLRGCLRDSDHAMRLDPTAPPDDGSAASHVSRLGGDEFMVLLREISRPADAGIVAERILAALRLPLVLGQHEIQVSTSIGIAVLDADSPAEIDLLRNADLAMYYAKRRGNGGFAFFDEGMSAASLRRMTLEGLLRTALANDELSVQFQPQLDMQSGEVCGMEALARWNCPGIGIVAPTEFIPVAEESGLILSIGEWILRAACSQAALWNKEGCRFGRIAVNVSALQFINLGFPDLVRGILEAAGLPAEQLELEVTETLLINDEAGAYEMLCRLKAIGITISIDDFGTGYSSLNRLKNFPVDRLKIDRSFIRGMHESSDDRAITNAIISMARTLGLGITAEGVDDPRHLTHLREQSCDEVQGFLLSKPLSTQQATQFLQSAASDSTAERQFKIAG